MQQNNIIKFYVNSWYEQSQRDYMYKFRNDTIYLPKCFTMITLYRVPFKGFFKIHFEYPTREKS